jgi:cytochrome P450 family 142 subfamily A polypeptide 1
MANHPQNPGINLLDGRFYAADPHPYFTWMRAHAPVYWDEHTEVWGIAAHADIMQVSKNPQVFCNSQGMRPDQPAIPSMINMDDPQHVKRRRLVSSGFTPRRVQDHGPQVRAVCRDLVARAAQKGSFDFVRDVAAPLPMIMIGDMLGVLPEDRDRLLRWSDDLIRGTSATASADAAAAAMDAYAEYCDYNREVVADRRRRGTGGDDLMSILVHAEIDGEKLDDEALLQESLLILIGGDETTRHVISGGMHQLLHHPEQYRKLVDEPAKIPTAVEEMLRWVTPIQNMSRTVTRTVELHGKTVREGDKVLLLYPSANRDEAVFDRPFEFDIERTPNPHVAFGGYGAHFCLGASLARLELVTMFEEIVREMPVLEFASADPVPMRPSNFIVGIEEMAVRVANS